MITLLLFIIALPIILGLIDLAAALLEYIEHSERCKTALSFICLLILLGIGLIYFYEVAMALIIFSVMMTPIFFVLSRR